MAIKLTSSYQYIGRSNAVSSPNGWNYYILLYAKTSPNQSTGKHTVSTKLYIACTNDSSFHNWDTTGYVKVAGTNAFSWSNAKVPLESWGNSSSLAAGDYTYKRHTLLDEGSVVVDTAFAEKNITLTAYWKMEDSNSAGWFPYKTPAEISATVTLSSIATASVPTVSASSVVMGKTVTITTNRKSSALTHTLTYKVGEKTGTIASGVGASYTWTVPWFLNIKSSDCTITCKTYSGSNLLGTKTTSLTINAPAATTPTLSVTTANFGDKVKISVESSASTNLKHQISYKVGSKTGSVFDNNITYYEYWTIPWFSDVKSSTCTIYCKTYNGTALIGEKSAALTVKAPAASELTFSDATPQMGQKISIYTNRKATQFTHTLTYSFGGKTGTIGSSVGASKEWTVPDLAEYCNNAASGSLTITCKTYNGAALIGTTSRTDLVLSVQDATTPTVNKTSANLGTVVRVSTPKKSENFTHWLTYSFGGKTFDLYDGYVKSYIDKTFSLKELAPLIPTKKQDTCTITCKTYNGTKLVGTKTVSLTLKVPNNSTTKPQFNYAFSPFHSGMTPSDDAITADYTDVLSLKGKYVRGKSKLRVNFTASSEYSRISSYLVRVNNAETTVNEGTPTATATAQLTTGNISKSGEISVTLRVTDQRGYYRELTGTIDVIPYYTPYPTVTTCKRCDQNGAITSSGEYLYISAKRTYSKMDGENVLSGAEGTQGNRCYLRVRYKLTTASSYGDWIYLLYSSNLSKNEYAGIVPGITLPTDKSYDVQIRAGDAIGYTTSTYKVIPTDYVTFFLGEGGKNAGFGKYPDENNALEIASDWKLHALGDAVFDGYLYDKHGTRIRNGISQYLSSGIDANTTLESPVLTNVNVPRKGYYYYIHTTFDNVMKSATANRAQIAIPWGSDLKIAHRHYKDGVWSEWIEPADSSDLLTAKSEAIKSAKDYTDAAVTNKVATFTATAAARDPSAYVRYNPATNTCFLRLYFLNDTACTAGTTVDIGTIASPYAPSSGYALSHFATKNCAAMINGSGVIRLYPRENFSGGYSHYISGFWFV